MSSIPSNAVEKVIQGKQVQDKEARVAELEKQLTKVKADIAEQERLDKRMQTFVKATQKLRHELGKTLTCEEYQAIDGIYIFLHSGCVDFVRDVPSATDRGENKALNKDLNTVEALRELEDLTK